MTIDALARAGWARPVARAIRATVELRPAETENIGSNLDTAETARLLELAKVAFEREVEADRALRERARGSAERQIRALLQSLGFADVRFVDALPSMPATWSPSPAVTGSPPVTVRTDSGLTLSGAAGWRACQASGRQE